MRPVNRGACPRDTEGNDIVYTHYSYARKELITRMGEYCSYCESNIQSGLHIEHVKPKQPPGATEVDQVRALSWNNFLLACTNCNSTKTNKEVVLNDYLWPDCDNTFAAFIYSEGGIIHVAPTDVRTQAHAMIKLVGLDKKLDTEDASDRRWINRKTAWDKAQRAKVRLARNDSADFRDQIVETAANGFWSVWMTVFRDDPDMLQRFIAAIPGTSRECFDNVCQCIARPGGQC